MDMWRSGKGESAVKAPPAPTSLNRPPPPHLCPTLSWSPKKRKKKKKSLEIARQINDKWVWVEARGSLFISCSHVVAGQRHFCRQDGLVTGVKTVKRCRKWSILGKIKKVETHSGSCTSRRSRHIFCHFTICWMLIHLCRMSFTGNQADFQNKSAVIWH